MGVSLWIGRSAHELKPNSSTMAFDSDEVVDVFRFPPLLYTTHGKETIERLWQETLDELAFVDIGRMLNSIKTH
jgi:hypothetical protein